MPDKHEKVTPEVTSFDDIMDGLDTADAGPEPAAEAPAEKPAKKAAKKPQSLAEARTAEEQRRGAEVLKALKSRTAG